MIRQFLKFVLSSNRTVISSPINLLRKIHATHHEPILGLHPKSAFHVKHEKNILFEVKHSYKGLTPLGQYFVDFSDNEIISQSREFKKTAFEKDYAVNLDEFGSYITVHLFQGEPKEIMQRLDLILKDPGYGRVIVPHQNGFYVIPSSKGRYIQLIYDDEAALTIGILAFGVKEGELDFASPVNSAATNFSGKYVALGHGKKWAIKA